MTRDSSAATRFSRSRRFVRSAARTAGLLGVILAATFGYNTWAAIEASNPPTSTDASASAATSADAAAGTSSGASPGKVTPF